MAEVRHGIVIWTDERGQPQPVRINLSVNSLTLQREEFVYATPPDGILDNDSFMQERKVVLDREKIGGLGLSVKGGDEHGLPILISRIFKGQAADKTGKLFVGDAIVRVNDINVEHCSHDHAVSALKCAGDTVALTLKYFQPASFFLTRQGSKVERKSDNEILDNIQSSPAVDKVWTDMLTIPLIFAYLTRYSLGTDKLRPNALEVVAMDNTSSGVLQMEDTQSLLDWIYAISHNIAVLNQKSIALTNKLLVLSEQIVFMGWVCERVAPNRHWPTWKPQFLAIKGGDLCLINTPPVNTRDWIRCDRAYKVYECMFRIYKDIEYVDERQHCFSIQTGNGETHYMNTETREDLLCLEKAWHRANFLAVTHLKNKTFGCNWRGRISGFTLDLNVGFSLYDSQTRSYMWSYKFSQLKGSSDDGKTRLKLLFQSDDSDKQVDTREIECTNLHTLLFCMQSFLSAKLASVDPAFLHSF